jgi:formylglycine-generating enzyme
VYNLQGMRLGLFLLVVAAALVAGRARADEHLVLDLGGTTLETRHVVHGTFTQGSAHDEVGHDKDEEPAHQVTISHDFWMGKFPVTKGQFAKFVADTRYVTDAEKGPVGGAGWDGKGLVQKKDFSWRNPGFTQTDEHPVVLVSYGDANAFSGWASRKTGKRVRLPTEAEWEYAARGGTTTPWYGGSTEAETLAIGWFKGNAGNGTRPVGQKKANPLGLFDMSGNVFEWCRDVYGPYHDAATTDPEGTAGPAGVGFEGERRALRGGSWLRDIKRARSGARHKNAPGSRNADNGFRVVVTNEEIVGGGAGGPGIDFAPTSPLGLGAAGAGAANSGLAAGPLADGDPVRLDPIAHGSEGFSWGLLLASPLASASAVVAWMLLRRKRSTRPAPLPATRSGASTRAGEDGFFLRVPSAPPGSRARYECLVDGKTVTDVVPLAGEETFVYTGSPPSNIRIIEVGAPPRGHRAAGRPPVPAGVDPGLIPPSSPRPRPPAVPAPKPVPSSPPQTLLQPHPATAHHRESPIPPVPLTLPVVVEPMPVSSPSPSPPSPSSARIPLSSRVPPPSSSSIASPPSSLRVPVSPRSSPPSSSRVPAPPPSSSPAPYSSRIPPPSSSPGPPSSSPQSYASRIPPPSSPSPLSPSAPPSSRVPPPPPSSSAISSAPSSSRSPPLSARVPQAPLAPRVAVVRSPFDPVPSDPPSTDVLAPEASSKADGAKSDPSSPSDASPGEAFLGNPRAY